MSGTTPREPTAKQRQQARQEGFAPISRELVFAIGFSLLAVCAWLRGPGLVDHLAGFVKSQFASAAHLTPMNAVEEVRRSAFVFVSELSPFLLIISVTVFLGHWVQQGPLWTPDRLMPDLGRMDPAQGWMRMFRLTTVLSTLVGVAKLIVIPTAVGWAIWRNADTIIALYKVPIDQMLPAVSFLALRIAAACALGMLGIAVVDLAGRRWLSERDLRQRLSERNEEVKAVQNDVAQFARRRANASQSSP